MAAPPPKPEVLIVGAGLAGLMLAMLLERIDVPYHIYERASVVKPLGSAMALGPSILPVFEQLGLLDQVKSIGKPYRYLDMYSDKLVKIGSIDMSHHEKLVGYEQIIFARPRLYEIMLKQVPPEKISHNKKVLRTEEADGKVTIFCSDNTRYTGDILVGADGAYSGVRQNLYRQLDENGLLPKSDLENFTFGFINMVAVAEPDDPSKFPQLADDQCHFSLVVGGVGGRGWGAMTVPDNQICWALGIQLSESEAKSQQFRNSEWGPESIDVMYKDYENLPSPWGGTMGDIMKYTPKDRISKVFLEEKIFKTWYGGQTVLIGDACHKMLTGAGLGAVNAMHDAVVLANCIYNMTDNSRPSITEAFKEYHGQRFHRLDDQFKRSQTMMAVMSGKTWVQRMTRHAMLNYVPRWAQDRDFIKSMEYRPQVAWLPLVPNRGVGKVQPQDGKRELYTDRQERLKKQYPHANWGRKVSDRPAATATPVAAA
ncbi:hypothetical protein B0O80DRAFT_500784 [Mortierella sp. GBAus27b]|nr:hypothetical protein BGX31_009326 [Mortierella sp. GBA43]KAI8350187.1 hypothetical protein B0O80DRAFT_500784 [Mortierella sp. GBAus27b]